MKHKHSHRRSNFLVSYILLSLIPLVVLGSLFVFSIDGLYKMKVYDDIKNNLELFVRDFNHEAQNFSDIVSQMRIQGVIRDGYDFESDPLYANNIKQAFASIVLTSPFYSDVIFYRENSDYLFSSESSFEKEMFFRNFYELDGYVGDGLRECLDTLDHPVTLRLHNKFSNTDRITYCHPVKNYKGDSEGVMLFVFSSNKFQSYVESRSGIDEACLTISSSDGAILFDNRDEVLEDRKYYRYDYEIHDLGWNIEFYVPKDMSLIHDLSHQMAVFFVALLLVITLSAFAITYFMKLNYMPLARLRKKVVEMDDDSPDGGVESSVDEYEIIDKTINRLSSRNSNLMTEIERLQKSRRNIELQKLVTGGYYDSIEDFNETNKGVIDFDGGYFCFICLMFDDICSDLEGFASRMKDELDEYALTYYVFTPLPKRLYLICNLSDMFIGSRLLVEVERVRTVMEEEFNNKLTIGISRFREGISEIPSLFLEAKSALDYRFVKGSGRTISFDEIREVGFAEYPKTEIDNLKRAILSKNNEQIENGLNAFISFLEGNSVSLFVAKGLCFDILRTYMISNPDLDMKAGFQNEIIALSDVETAENLINTIKNHLKGTASEGTGNTCLDVQTLDSIKKYIQANYLDCNFSLSDVADVVGMNVSKLSIFYKKATGKYLVDYVSSLRMESAKKLLETTDLPVKEISIAVGYYNASSFIRRFRQTQGVSPGDYRKIFQSGM